MNMLKQKFKKWIKKPELVFLTLASIFGLLSAAVLPLLANPDEGYHLYASYATFSDDSDLPDDILLNPFEVLGSIEGSTYQSYFTERVDFDDDSFGLAVNRDLEPSESGYINVPAKASITDIGHLPQALGVLLGKIIYPSIGSMVLLGRLLNLAVYVIAIYFVIKKVRHAKWAFTLIALFPMLIHQAGSLSYDALTIVAIFSFVALMFNLYTQKTSVTKNQVILLILLSVALLITKQSNIILLILVPFLPRSLYTNTRLWQLVTTKISPRLFIAFGAIAALGLVALFVIVANKYAAGHSTGIVDLLKIVFRTYTGTNPELNNIVTTGIVGNFSWNYYRFPEWVVILNAITLTLVLFAAKFVGLTRRLSLISLLALIGSILAVTIGIYFSWSTRPFVLGEGATYAQGLQGRYFTPLLVLLIPCVAYLQKYIKVQAKENAIALLVITTSIFSLVYYLLITYTFFYS